MHFRRKRFTARVAVALVCVCVATITDAVSVVAQVTRPDRPFVLSMSPSVRSVGLQGSGAALLGSSGAIFSNPAGIATLRHVGLEGSYRSVPSGGSLSAASIGWRLRQFDLGFGVERMDFGSEPGRLLGSGVPTGADADEIGLVGSGVYRFGMIAFGGSTKFLRRSVDATDDDAFSGDAGIAIAFLDIAALGFAVQNIGGNWKKNAALDLPRLTRLGVTLNYLDPLDAVRLLSTAELQWPEGRGSRLVLGGEGGVVDRGFGIIVRGAFKSRPAGTNLSEFTFGASVILKNVAIDWAFQENDVFLDTAHHFGLRLAL